MKFKLPSFEKANIFVMGDVMLDRYWHGSTDRISPEAPVPVVHINQIDERPGGAGNVALNIRSLESHVTLFGMVGDDEAANVLERKLDAADVAHHLHRDPIKPTITKLRVLSRHQQLIRMDFEESFANQSDSSKTASPACHSLAAFERADVIIISDYRKGSIGNYQEVIQFARARNIPVLIDPKGGDFSIYRGATLLTPNLKEFELVVGPCADESILIQKGLALLKEYQLEALLITRGAEGMTLLREGKSELHLPAKAREVYDVTGAGDTVIAVIAAALGAGSDLPMAVALANRAAGIAVKKLGTATVTLPELKRSILKDANIDRGMMTEDQIILAIEEARALGERIVMTNGCFDILHPGHVTYLARAKELGTRLVVAMNDDASVARLKGPSRPINTLNRRAAVLAGLSSVDWIVPFSEDTPERLIGMLSPDVLVKGGDYQVDDIAGSRYVIENGGEVKVLNFEEGCSTTLLINKIKNEVIS